MLWIVVYIYKGKKKRGRKMKEREGGGVEEGGGILCMYEINWNINIVVI